MHWLNHSVPRVVAGFAGAILIALACLLYEDDEKKIQSRLEKFWVAIDDRAKAGVTRSIALMQEAARVVGAFLDRIFGEKLFSARTVVVSIFYSIVSILLASGLYKHDDGSYLLTVSLAVAGFALLPIIPRAVLSIRSLYWSLAISSAFVVVIFIQGNRLNELGDAIAEWVPLILLGVGYDFVYIVAIRKLLRVTIRDSRYAAIALIAAASLAIIALVPWVIMDYWFGVFFEVTPKLYPKWHLLTAGAFLSLDTNLIGGIAALLVFVLIGVALLHRIIWPVLSRPIYALYRHKVISNHVLLFGIAAVLLIYAIPGLSWLKELK